MEMKEQGMKGRIQQTEAELDFGSPVYRMKGAFPESIRVSGREVLAAPIRLRAEFDGLVGQWKGLSMRPYRQDGQQILFSVRQGTENIMLNARLRAQEDGLLWIDFAIIPFGRWRGGEENIVPRLTGLALELPLKPALAQLYHYWPAEDNGIEQVHEIRNSGAVPAEGLRLPFKPCLWLGCEEAGLALYMESDEALELQEGKPVLELVQEEGVALLRLNLLDHMPRLWQGREDRWGDPLGPLVFAVGLQATPVRAFQVKQGFDRCFHTHAKALYEMDGAALEDHFERLQALGVKWRTLHEDWTDAQNDAQPRDQDKLRLISDAAHRHGIKLMCYFGYEVSTLHPDWFEHREDWLIKTPGGSFAGGWQRMPWQRAYMACYKGGYAQMQRQRVAYAMDELGIDGIYLDNAFLPWGCANAGHGCGYVDSEGRRRQSFPLLAVREHVRQLQALIHERGGILEAHQSGSVIPMLLSFADSCFDGEQIQAEFAQDAAQYLNEGAIRSEFTGRTIGVPMQFLQIAEDYTQGAGIMLLFGVPSKAYNGQSIERAEQASDIWRRLDAFGAEDARFVDYWQEDCPVRADRPGVLCSCWLKEGRALVVAVNVTGEELEAGVHCFGQEKRLRLPRLRPVFVQFEQQG